MRYFAVVDDIRTFFIKKRAEFSENRVQYLLRRSVFKISVRQHTLFFDVFFKISRVISQPCENQFLSEIQTDTLYHNVQLQVQKSKIGQKTAMF